MYLFLKMEDAVTSLAICANMNFVGFVNRNIKCIRNIYNFRNFSCMYSFFIKTIFCNYIFINMIIIFGLETFLLRFL
jgi:hypothetical protein